MAPSRSNCRARATASSGAIRVSRVKTPLILAKEQNAQLHGQGARFRANCACTSARLPVSSFEIRFASPMMRYDSGESGS